MSDQPAGYTVVITDSDFPSTGPEERELSGLATVRRHHCTTEAEVLAAAGEADGVMVQYAPITARVLASLRRCRVIARYGVGLDMIDLSAARERGIPVCNVPDYCLEEVSDHAVALILAGVRKLVVLNDSVRSGVWDCRVARPVPRLADCTVGLIGFGRIARRVARKLSGFGCPLLVHDPFVAQQIVGEHGAAAVGLEELLERGDVVSLHTPLTPATRRMIDAAALLRMKPTALLVNTSRGGLIDEQALAEALKAGRIGGAALDVLEREPPTPDSPLRGLRNLILTPHAAFYSEQSMPTLQAETARAVARVLRQR
jgi:D-3-phosphoglycerate dehydrogenase